MVRQTVSRHRPLTTFIAAAVVAAFGAVGLQSAPSPLVAPAEAVGQLPYEDTSLPFEVRAADLVSRMTLAEKAQQLRATNPNFGGQSPAISRLGVRAYSYWNEALHGVARAGQTAPATPAGYTRVIGDATEFPTGLGLATSWNRELVGQMAKATSSEARGYYEDEVNSGGRWGLTFWSPTINMHRDPRWGRAEETYGEDPYLTSQIGAQFVSGMQGDLEDNGGYLKAVTTPKHYSANNSENDRHSGSANLTEAELREYYTPAYATLWKDYGAASGMTAYSAVNGVPQSANFYFLETLARRTWGFDGFITSDCGAIDDVTDTHTAGANDGHAWAPGILGRPATRAEGTAWSLKAGTDVDCTGGQYSANLIPAIQQGLLTENDVNINLTRAFTVRMRLGEFDPSTPWSDYTIDNQVFAAGNLATAQAASDEGVVMLKNEGLLPFADTVDDVLLLGELGDTIVHGDYSPTTVPPDLATKTVRAALEDQLVADGGTVAYEPGAIVPVQPGIGTIQFLDGTGAVLAAYTPHELVGTANPAYVNYAANIFDGTGWGFPGLYFADQFDPIGTPMTGSVTLTLNVPTATAQISIAQMGSGWGYIPPPTPGGTFTVSQVTGTPGVVATIPQAAASGSVWGPFVYTDPVAYSGAKGTGVRLEFAYSNTSQFGPQVDPDNPAAPLNAAVASAEAVIAYVGTLTSDSAEEQDRASIALPRYQAEVANNACEINPNTVVYIQAVGEVDIRPFLDNCRAILWSTYNGQDQGPTVPRILWGDVNPSGKLPFTYYEDPVRDLRETTDYTMTPTDGRLGRTYQYFTGPPLYPFGYGLSYSHFTYANLQLSKTAVTPNDKITVSVDVTNTSAVPGKEVVQVYVASPKAGDLLRPDRQLKGFEKVSFGANETKTVSIEIDVADLWFWDDATSRHAYDTGSWVLTAGPSSDPAQGLNTNFTLSGTLAPTLDVVAAIPDGTVLNTLAPDNAIHANLSATRTDESFYDLSKVTVRYTSSNTAVAKVDATGAVTAAGPGVAQITASVTADGTTKSDTFPVVVYDGALVASDGTVLFDKVVAFADQDIAVADAQGGVTLDAKLAPATWGSEVVYSIAPMDTNTAGAAVTTSGKLTATKPGLVRVTAVASRDGNYYSHTATVNITASNPTGLNAAVASASAIDTAGYTTASANALAAAVANAKAVAADPTATQAQVDAAATAVRTAVSGLQAKGNTGSLAALADLAKELAGSANLTADQKAALEAAVASANTVLGDPANASQAAVASAVEAINAALAQASAAGATASPAQAKAALASLLASLGTANEAAYTPATWAPLKTALDAAKALAANPAATADQLNAAISAIATAVAGLAPVPAAPAPKQLKSATPKIKGTAKVGKTLKVTKGSWTAGAKFTYRWYAGGKAIKGATKASLKLKAAQKGKKITVRVTGKLAGYANKTVTSKATKAVK
jgi:beta-glucosidase-like glycosyl hydrolase